MTKEIRDGIAIILRSVYKSNTPEGWDINILEYLHSKDVVIRVDRELPNDCIYRSPKQEGAYCAGRDTVLKAGYVATEPLIEEGHD